MNRQRGQSMTEFAVGAALLGLLLLGTTVLAGYQETDRRNVIAARQVAYQGSWNGRQVAAASMHRGFFADPGVVEPGRGRSYVVAEDLELASAHGAVAGRAADAAAVMLSPLHSAGGFFGGGFDLANDGLHSGRMQARIAPIPWLPAPFSALDLTLTAPFALLGDAWHAAGPSQVQARAAGLVPGNRLVALRGLWQVAAQPLQLVEPAFGQLCLGLVEPDRIPEDRLGAGASPLPGRCL